MSEAYFLHILTWFEISYGHVYDCQVFSVTIYGLDMAASLIIIYAGQAGKIGQKLNTSRILNQICRLEFFLVLFIILQKFSKPIYNFTKICKSIYAFKSICN